MNFRRPPLDRAAQAKVTSIALMRRHREGIEDQLTAGGTMVRSFLARAWARGRAIARWLRMTIARSSAMLALSGFTPALCVAAIDPQRVMAETFFRPTDFTKLDLSPDGTHVLYLITKRDSRNALGVLEIATESVKTAGLGRDDNVFYAEWLDAQHVLAGFRHSGANQSNWLLMLRRDTMEGTTVADYISNVVGVPRRTPTQPWVSYDDGTPSVLQLDGLGRLSPKKTGRERNLISRIEAPDRKVNQWLSDPDGEVRGCVVLNPIGNAMKVYWRPDLTKSDWVPVTFDWSNAMPFGFSRDGKILISAYLGHPTRGIYLLDAASGEPGPCLYRDAEHDIPGVSVHHSARGNGIAGLRYERELTITVWFEPAMRGLQEFIDRQLPDRTNLIMDWDDAESVFLIYSSADQNPGVLYVLDLKSRKLKRLGDAYPAVNAKTLSPTRVIPFTTQDGLTFEALLTVPRDATHERPAPLVLYIDRHPWLRPKRGYSNMAQWLAANGIACLVAEHRGGRQIPDSLGLSGAVDLRGAAGDHIEAVRAALQTGVVDMQRVGMIGNFLGARVALAVAAEAPAMFRCMVLTDGVYDNDAYLLVIKSIDPTLHAGIQRRVEASPALAESFRERPIAELSGSEMHLLLTFDAPINEVATLDSWPSWVHRQSVSLRRDFKSAGIDAVLRPIDERHAKEIFDRHVIQMAGIGTYLKEKL